MKEGVKYKIAGFQSGRQVFYQGIVLWQMNLGLNSPHSAKEFQEENGLCHVDSQARSKENLYALKQVNSLQLLLAYSRARYS